jgi:CubicO group peptidase (beta-lactamase class C family)
MLLLFMFSFQLSVVDPVGLWGAERVFGPDLGGAMTVRRDARNWTATIGNASATFPSGDSMVFRFGPTRGTYRFHVSNGGRELRGFWIQPPLRSGPQPFSTPTSLRRIAANRWVGQVAPLTDAISVYLDIRRQADGSLFARLRNPDGSLGDGAYRVKQLGNSLRLIDASDSAQQRTARFDSSRGTVTLDIPDLGSWTLTRRDRNRAIGFYARTPTTPYAYRPPEQIADGWTTGSLRQAELDEPRIDSLVQRILDVDAGLARQPLVHSVLIARHGKLVLEEYFYGFTRDTPHDLRSGSKTFASILVNLAVRRGATIDPTARVYTSFSKYRPFENEDARKSRISLAHLMTMTSGLACDENDDSSPGNEGTMQSQTSQPDWYKFTLDLPMAHAPGDTAVYCSATVNLIGGVIRNASHIWLPQLFDEGLAEPLGFGPYHFDLMPTGEAYLGGGVHMRPRDLLKIGQLYLDHGKWGGRQLIDSDWVAESVRPHTEISPSNTDGYDWHTDTLRIGDRRLAEYYAAGNGGQLLIIVPELELVVAFTAGNYNSYGVWRAYREEWLARYIIPH